MHLYALVAIMFREEEKRKAFFQLVSYWPSIDVFGIVVRIVNHQSNFWAPDQIAPSKQAIVFKYWIIYLKSMASLKKRKARAESYQNILSYWLQDSKCLLGAPHVLQRQHCGRADAIFLQHQSSTSYSFYASQEKLNHFFAPPHAEWGHLLVALLSMAISL